MLATLVLAIAGLFMAGWPSLNRAAPSSDADAAARVYLDEASALEAAGDRDGARLMLRRARAAGSANPAIDVALTRLERELGMEL